MLPPVKNQRVSSINKFTNLQNILLEMDGYATENMEFSKDQLRDASSFCNFYIDLIHSFSDKTKYFLSDDVVLDYFGHTIKGQKNVTSYIKSNLMNVEHLFEDAKPVEKIGFRDTHIVKLPKEIRKTTPFFSPPKTSAPETPPRASGVASASTSAPKPVKQMKEGVRTRRRTNDACSPAKRLKMCRSEMAADDEDVDVDDLTLEMDVLESEKDPIRVKYVTAEGHVEFRKPSTKKLQVENRWKRPCKLSVAYSSSTDQDCTIYLVIYEGNVRCRRNLLKDFEETTD